MRSNRKPVERDQALAGTTLAATPPEAIQRPANGDCGPCQTAIVPNHVARAAQSASTSAAATLGKAIAAARKERRISQKGLAAAVLKDDGSGPISPQYLNDIEHDRRCPSSDHLIRQFAKALSVNENYLFVLAGKIPDEVRLKARDPDKVAAAFLHFCKSVSS